MNEFLVALRWYLGVQFFAVVSLPLCLRLCRRLPDRGYSLSKPFGLLLSGWVFWILGTTGLVRNTAGGVIVAAATVALAGLALHFRHRGGISLPPWQVILATEILFLVAFGAWCLVRAQTPAIEPTYGEKWMEIALLRGILRSDVFPPNDPWLSGYSISYYYFGYLIMGMVTRLTGVLPSIAFNLSTATLFGLTCTGAFGIVFDLVTAGARSPAAKPNGGRSKEWGRLMVRALLAGLLAAVLVAAMGNLEGLLESVYSRGLGPPEFWAWLDIEGIEGAPPPSETGSWQPTGFRWWWHSSRVVQDYLGGVELLVLIDETPVFSFLLGDLHPHVLGLPFALLAIGLSLNVFLRAFQTPGELTVRVLRWDIELPLAPWELIACGLVLGGLGFLNTWDLPIYFGLFVGAYAVGRLAERPPSWARLARGILLLSVSILLAAAVPYLPYWLGFQSQAGGPRPHLGSGTRMHQFVVAFSPVCFPAAAYVALEFRRRGLSISKCLYYTAIGVAGILVGAAVVLSMVVLLVRLELLPATGPFYYVDLWLSGEPIPGLEGVEQGWHLVLAILRGHLWPPEAAPRFLGLVGDILAAPIWVSAGLVALLIAAAKLIVPGAGEEEPSVPGEVEREQPVRRFVLLLIGMAALLALAVEYVYIDDVFHQRYNTAFKFWFQVWVLWGLAGAYALSQPWSAGSVGSESAAARRGSIAVLVVCGLVVGGGLLLPALAIPSRAMESEAPPTLDGAAYLAGSHADERGLAEWVSGGKWHQDDYYAIQWLNETIDGAPVILEAPGSNRVSFQYDGRVSAHTGLPTLLGWGGHEDQWRGSYEIQALREPDIETLYTSEDLAEVQALLEKYDIEYVYVGALERSRYPAEGLAKFAQLMDTAYREGTVTIYSR
jgi:YYY domain-containing protein